jgi:hypothetical protein
VITSTYPKFGASCDILGYHRFSEVPFFAKNFDVSRLAEHWNSRQAIWNLR